jgi:hypothetical protein
MKIIAALYLILVSIGSALALVHWLNIPAKGGAICKLLDIVALLVLFVFYFYIGVTAVRVLWTGSL